VRHSNVEPDDAGLGGENRPTRSINGEMVDVMAVLKDRSALFTRSQL
jgi:hypothetical protein